MCSMANACLRKTIRINYYFYIISGWITHKFPPFGGNRWREIWECCTVHPPRGVGWNTGYKNPCQRLFRVNLSAISGGKVVLLQRKSPGLYHPPSIQVYLSDMPSNYYKAWLYCSKSGTGTVTSSGVSQPVYCPLNGISPSEVIRNFPNRIWWLLLLLLPSVL